jgi:hypothetical protein
MMPLTTLVALQPVSLLANGILVVILLPIATNATTVFGN